MGNRRRNASSGNGVYMKKTRRLLALFLALVLCLSGTASAFAQGAQDDPASGNNDGVTVKAIDPSILKVKKLAEKLDMSNIAKPSEQTAKYAPEDVVRVSIVLSDPSTMDAGYSVKRISEDRDAKAYRETLKTQQAAVAAEISRKLGKTLDVKWNLTILVNIIAADVQYKDIKTIKLVPGVKNVFIDKQFTVAEAEAGTHTANTSEHMVGASQAWSSGYTGAGQLVAIIDTGIDTTHQSFDEGAFLKSISELDETVDLLEESEIPADDLSVPGIYVSAKIPFAYNYKDGNSTNLGHVEDTEGNHGSHVAGIAAANRLIPGETAGTYIDAAENVYAVGMAPDAQIAVMKVFGKAGGPYESDYMPAIEDALILGCAAVNLSLGSASEGWSFSPAYQDKLNALSAKEVETVVSISAGNSGTTTTNTPMGGPIYTDDVRFNTVGDPGSYNNSLAVASADNLGNTGEYLEFDGTIKAFYSDTSGEDTSFPAMNTIPGTWDYVYIEAKGEAADYSTVNDAVSLAGKIVIVNRGGNYFYEKGNNAKPFNPKAVVVANNEPGSFGMALDDFTGTFPMVMISWENSKAIKAEAASAVADGITYYTGTVTVSGDIYSGLENDYPTMSSFSSWGVPGSLILKPEITAPGGNIYSVNGSSIAPDDHNDGPTSYVNYSGTSMAAPHITGLTAVFSEYLDKNDISLKNAALAEKYSKRAIMQSLMMSTASPMFDPEYETYYPVLQQGAGLVNINDAMNAKSVIMMGEEDFTLGSVTGSAADGKVKAELGDYIFDTDFDHFGRREFSFTIYNIDDKDQEIHLDTDLFIQGWYGEDDYENNQMALQTIDVEWDVQYDYDKPEGEGHDVNKDGKTNKDDAQAILDVLTGNLDASLIDRAAADMDADGDLTSYDSYLLLTYVQSIPDALIVPAGGSKEVKVTITPDKDDVAFLLQDGMFPNGFYMEGFTYAYSVSNTDDGGVIDTMHSIPILGFIGSWTDASMFDANSLISYYYGPYKFTDVELEDGTTDLYPNYSGSISNYLTLTYNGVPQEFFGNPYAVEETFPADKLAINSRSVMKSFVYNMLRSGASTGYAVTHLFEDGGFEVLEAYLDEYLVSGIWYSDTAKALQDTDARVYEIGESPRELGLEEGDRFRVGYYAIPEYYGILLNMLYNMLEGDGSPVNGGYDGLIMSDDDFAMLLKTQFLGKGAYLGYDFTVDDTAPFIDQESIEFDSAAGTISFSAADNLNIAYVSIMSLDGENEYKSYTPASPDFDAEDVSIADAVAAEAGYIALFVADYAGNETAVSVQINDNTQGIDPNVVTGVTVDTESIDIYKGNKYQLIKSVTPITADQNVVWTTSDANVAVVDEFGEVTATGAGTAVITATSASYPGVSASCAVKVTSIDKELKGLLMDEDSQTFFVNFSTNGIPNWKKLHDDPQGAALLNAINTSSGLYASTIDSDYSYIYTVDPNTFEAKEYGVNYYPAFDMAPASFYGYDDMLTVFPYAYLLIIGNLEPEFDDELGGEFSGLPYGGTNLMEDLEGAWISGVALKRVGEVRNEYYMMDDIGRLWTITWSYREGAGFSFGNPTKVMETGIEADYMYQNLYFDGTDLFWSYYKGNTAHLVYLDTVNKKVYDAGSFGKKIWPVTGFYKDGTIGAGVDVQSVSGELQPMTFEQDTELKAMLADEALRAQVNARIEAAKKAGYGPAAAQTDGGLNKTNVVKTDAGKRELGTMATRPEMEEYPAEGTISIIITEEDITHNGKYEVDYEVGSLTFNEAASYFNGTITSHKDNGHGTITLAFADSYGIEGGIIIANLVFDVKGEETGMAVVNTRERNDEFNLTESNAFGTALGPVVRLKTAYLTLEGKIKINLKVFTQTQGLTARLYYEKDGYKDYVEVPLNADNYYSDSTGEYYLVSYDKVPAKEMDLHLRIKVYDSNGDVVMMATSKADLSSFDYTVATWCNNKINAVNPVEKDVMIAKALLNYGHYTQLALKYKDGVDGRPNRLVNPNGYLSEEMSTVAADPAYNRIVDGGAALGAKTFFLVLESDTLVKLRLARQISVVVNEQEAELVPETVDGTNYWNVFTSGIAAKKLHELNSFELTEGDSSATIFYGALSWANSKLAGSDVNDKNLAKAMYLYNYAARKYFGYDAAGL